MAARGALLALLTCKKYSFPFSIVNSISCISLKYSSSFLEILDNYSYMLGNPLFSSEISAGVLVPATTSSP